MLNLSQSQVTIPLFRCGSFIAGTASCRIQVQGIEELFEEYKKQGVLHSSDTKVEEQYWDHKEFPAVDNYGNLLTFYQII